MSACKWLKPARRLQRFKVSTSPATLSISVGLRLSAAAIRSSTKPIWRRSAGSISAVPSLRSAQSQVRQTPSARTHAEFIGLLCCLSRLPRLGHQTRLFVDLDPLLARNRRDQLANRFERQVVRRLEMNATLPHVELLPRRLERRLQLLETTQIPHHERPGQNYTGRL